MWASTKFNRYTGKPIDKYDLVGLVLTHNEGVVLEEKLHDWNINNECLHYYSRYIALGNPSTLILEYY